MRNVSDSRELDHGVLTAFGSDRTPRTMSDFSIEREFLHFIQRLRAPVLRARQQHTWRTLDKFSAPSRRSGVRKQVRAPFRPRKLPSVLSPGRSAERKSTFSYQNTRPRPSRCATFLTHRTNEQTEFQPSRSPSPKVKLVSADECHSRYSA